jgi:hypothetical protein
LLSLATFRYEELPITNATRFSASAGSVKSQNEQTAKTNAPTARIGKFPNQQ